MTRERGAARRSRSYHRTSGPARDSGRDGQLQLGTTPGGRTGTNECMSVCRAWSKTRNQHFFFRKKLNFAHHSTAKKHINNCHEGFKNLGNAFPPRRDRCVLVRVYVITGYTEKACRGAARQVRDDPIVTRPKHTHAHTNIHTRAVVQELVR